MVDLDLAASVPCAEMQLHTHKTNSARSDSYQKNSCVFSSAFCQWIQWKPQIRIPDAIICDTEIVGSMHSILREWNDLKNKPQEGMFFCGER